MQVVIVIETSSGTVEEDCVLEQIEALLGDSHADYVWEDVMELQLQRKDRT